ncbi:MAG TPA: hydrolase 2, exosortase A system-associated [Stellaceae bacterium]|nr:hydrolase 2, exosortase A system-associated [Stellaceae bacterium]
MSDRATPPPEPVFLAGPAGRLFAVYHAPAPSARRGIALVHVPPFAEEMNRARRMAALQACALAAAGIPVLLPDLHGTGDSEGEFRDARWPLWQADVRAAADWLQARHPGDVGLWGLRLGGLLAAELAAGDPGRFARLVLWQPVSEGKSMLTQFLRLRIAAAMQEGARQTTEALRAQLAAGEMLEVAGYEIAPELAADLDRARLQSCRPAGPVDWLDVAEATETALAPTRQRAVDAWREAGVTVAAEAVAGEPFWATQEIALAPRLIGATVRRLAA